jgi:hypothetical protein
VGTITNMGFLFTKERNFWLQGNEPLFLGHPAQNLVTIVTELPHFP